MPEYTADVVATGVLRVLEAVRLCGLEKTCRIYQACLLYTSGINMSVREYGVYQAFSVPFFILIGITGSMLCIWVGKAFQNCIVGTVLAYIGQNTICLLYTSSV